MTHNQRPNHQSDSVTYVGILGPSPSVYVNRYPGTTVAVVTSNVEPALMARASFFLNGQPAYLVVYVPGTYTITTHPSFRDDAKVRVSIDVSVYGELTRRPEAWGNTSTDEDPETGTWRNFSMGR